MWRPPSRSSLTEPSQLLKADLRGLLRGVLRLACSGQHAAPEEDLVSKARGNKEDTGVESCVTNSRTNNAKVSAGPIRAIGYEVADRIGSQERGPLWRELVFICVHECTTTHQSFQWTA